MDRQAGRQAQDLNPCLEQSRSQAAGKLSSVPHSASPLFPLIPRRSNVMVDIIALSSIYPSIFLSILFSVMEVTKWNEMTHEPFLSNSPMISVSRPEANVRLAAVRLYFLGISGSVLLFFFLLPPHPHTSGSLVHCFLKFNAGSSRYCMLTEYVVPYLFNGAS